jgi:hypothetical protein
MYTITIRKPTNIRSTVVYHGVKNPFGGSFETNHAGWSIKNAIAYEVSRLPIGIEYQIKVNGKITATGLKS